MKKPLLYLVIPCYNEDCVLQLTATTLQAFFHESLSEIISEDSRILFVDDGSTDNTWSLICSLHHESPLFEGVRLSRNKGHQTALMAGISVAVDYADVIITMDSDLQQDINALPRFLEQYAAGCDVVYGIRNSRVTDGVFKRWSATMYYKLMQFLGCELIDQSADYRLLSARAAKSLLEYREDNPFIRGLVPALGYPSGKVYFDVKERAGGESKYTLRKMLRLAADGITSFSIRPLRLIFLLGVVISLISLVGIVQAIYAFLNGETVSGWTSLTVSIWFLGGMNFIALGIIGEYIGRTYIESKKRPRFFIQDTCLHTTDQ